MCSFVRYFFLLGVLLIAIVDPLPDNDNNGPLPDAVPSETYFDTASSTIIDQFQNDLTLNQPGLPGDYIDPDAVVPHGWFLPHCTTDYTLCCTRLTFNFLDYLNQLLSKYLGGDHVVFGCTTCTPCLSIFIIQVIQLTEMSAPQMCSPQTSVHTPRTSFAVSTTM